MKHYTKIFLGLMIIMQPCSNVLAEGHLLFEQNKGQIKNSEAHFRAKLSFGDVLMNKDAFSYYLHDLQGESHGHDLARLTSVSSHYYKMLFVGANSEVKIQSSYKKDHYINYFLGNDPGKWISEVPLFEELLYQDIYLGIDIKVYQKEGLFTYDYILSPSANAQNIKVEYQGVERLMIDQGKLSLVLSNGRVQESKPYAYQWINGQKIEVVCDYILNENTVSFDFPKGYDKNQELIIDPTVIFSTYTGSMADNWGFTATYDAQGNMYTGGIAFNSSGVYPTTPGAYQTNFSGGLVDVVISKFNAVGNNMLYSTYLGGNDAEAPHSMIVDNQGNLLVFGSTSSTNFPTPNGYDQGFNGGLNMSMNGITYTNGSDIFVAKFNVSGSSLLSATYFGGSDNDGINNSFSPLNYNYGDLARGEIFLDNNQDVYIASCTRSSDLPTNVGVIQPNFQGGAADACVIRLNANLSGLIWTSYIGGTSDDAAYSIKIGTNGKVYISGGTRSSNMPIGTGGVNPSYVGNVDGFILALNASDASYYKGTFIGTNSYDQSYLLELNDENEVFVVGQTKGVYPHVNTLYHVPGSAQFIHKLSSDLSNTIYSAAFGTGSNAQVNISPCAFLVDTCGKVYVSGWGGSYTEPLSANQPSSTFGLPVSSPTLQSTTDGEDFYFVVFDQNMSGISFATYYGSPNGSSDGEHVDGGTSRFDKNGAIYQSVCASCGGFDNFPTTPGVWSNINPSANCNLAAIKIQFDPTIVEASNLSDTVLCYAPYLVNFSGFSSNANTHYWDFGVLGQSATIPNPQYTYTEPGTYTVMYVAGNLTTCNLYDTAYLQVYIPEPVNLDSNIIHANCHGDNGSILLSVTGGDPAYSYQWSVSGVGGSTASLPAGSYTAMVTDGNGCKDTILAEITQPDSLLANYQTISPICHGDTGMIIIQAQGGTPGYTYYANPGGLQEDTLFVPAGVYLMTVFDSNLCSVTLTTALTQPLPVLAQFDTSGVDYQYDFDNQSNIQASSWIWNFGDGSQSVEENPSHTYAADGVYQVILTAMDSAGCLDTAIKVIELSNELVFIPNVFTPNGSGHNDQFVILAQGMKEYDLKIYNRWGLELFHSNTPGVNWDGRTSSGSNASEGTYYYILRAIGQKDYSQSGYFSLLR